MTHIRSYKYPLLNDKVWLYDNYINKGLSTRKLAKLAGAKTPNSARQALIRNSIPLRNISDGLTINRKPNSFILDTEVIDGCLLGDASLVCWNPRSEISNSFFRKKNMFLSHIEFVAKQLYGDDYNSHISSEWIERFQKNYFVLRSHTHKSLKIHYKRWYPVENSFKKLVPKDIILTPKTILHWFLDDGSSYQRRKHSNTKQAYITLSSESFSYEDNKFLVNKLKNEYKLSCRVAACNSGTGYRIIINQSSYESFLKVIGECPFEEMKYKWK